MVLGMFSMLGGVFAVDASAAATPYTTHIKTYAELEEEHPNGFYYFGVEFIEADGQPTDISSHPAILLPLDSISNPASI